jgi:hypothetical protein
MVMLATAATVIASQAVITGAFSLSRQAVQLGLLPRLRDPHTSADAMPARSTCRGSTCCCCSACCCWWSSSGVRGRSPAPTASPSPAHGGDAMLLFVVI